MNVMQAQHKLLRKVVGRTADNSEFVRIARRSHVCRHSKPEYITGVRALNNAYARRRRRRRHRRREL